jgi:hypothetical protein
LLHRAHGRDWHPAVPALSVLRGAKRDAKLGQIVSRECEAVSPSTVVIARLDVWPGRPSTPRPIGSSTTVSGILDHPHSRVMTSRMWLHAPDPNGSSGSSTRRLLPTDPPFPILALTAAPLVGTACGGPLQELPIECSASADAGTAARILQCSNIANRTLLKGQWHSPPLLCIGAAGCPGAGGSCSAIRGR